jgi:hypothetical protein
MPTTIGTRTSCSTCQKSQAQAGEQTCQGLLVVLDDREVPEPQTIFMVPVSRWSDGTTAAAH